MLKVVFSQISEIRMGSPYKVAKVAVEGVSDSAFRDFDFQDKMAIACDGCRVALIQWEVAQNEPGFRVWMIREGWKTVLRSKRIQGLCEGLSFEAEEVIVTFMQGKLSQRVVVDFSEPLKE